jgi:hypothetical protein
MDLSENLKQGQEIALKIPLRDNKRVKNHNDKHLIKNLLLIRINNKQRKTIILFKRFLISLQKLNQTDKIQIKKKITLKGCKIFKIRIQILKEINTMYKLQQV